MHPLSHLQAFAQAVTPTCGSLSYTWQTSIASAKPQPKYPPPARPLCSFSPGVAHTRSWGRGHARTWKKGARERTGAGGGPRAAPPGTPPLPCRRCCRRQTLGAPPAPKHADQQSEGGDRTPPRRACALRGGHAAVPPPGGNPALLLVLAEERTARPPMRRPQVVGGAWAFRGADGGGRSALAAVTSGSLRGALPWKPRFHPRGFPGAAPSHSAFSSMGGGGCAGPTPPPRSRSPHPLLASVYLSVPPTLTWAGLPPSRRRTPSAEAPPLHLPAGVRAAGTRRGKGRWPAGPTRGGVLPGPPGGAVTLGPQAGVGSGQQGMPPPPRSAHPAAQAQPL
nr:protein transport protein SEC31-like [Equus asinus]